MDFLEPVIDFVRTNGTNLIVCVFAVVFGILIIRNLIRIIKMIIIDSKLEKSMVKLVVTLIKFVLYFLLVLYVLNKLGVSLTGFVAVFSAFSLALGLAVQDVIGGLANGFVIASTKPFEIGDFVDIGGVSGTVMEINLMHTVLETPDRTQVYLPNKTVYNSQILNYTTNPLRRLDYDICIDFSADKEKVIECLENVLSSSRYVLKNPSSSVFISDIEPNGVKYRLRCWVKNRNYWDLYFNLRDSVYNGCTEKGIKFALPRISVSENKKSISEAEE